MNNDRLNEWNDAIEEARRMRLDAMERGMRSRGFKRRVNLMAARWFGWVHELGKRWRNEDMRDD